MPSETITTQYSIGDIVYYVIYPTCDIIQGQVLYVRILPLPTTGVEITYRLQITYPTSIQKIVDYVQESELMTFLGAKTALLSWLTTQTSTVSAMTEPTLPVV